jgi:hypothetical protein
MIGVTSPVGVASLIFAVMPPIAVVSVQLAHGVQKMKVQARVRDAISKANVSFDHASKDADDAYRDHLVQCRRTLTLAESDLKKVQNAMRALGQYKAKCNIVVEDEAA